MGRSLICVTVGTLDKPFDRLLRLVAAVRMDAIDWSIQYGVGDRRILDGVEASGAELRDFVTDGDLTAIMNKASVIVSHAGVGSILKANGLGKPLIIVPRLSNYDEHFDDHQRQITNYLRGRSGIYVVDDSEPGYFYRQLQLALSTPDNPEPLLRPEKIQDFVSSRVG